MLDFIQLWQGDWKYPNSNINRCRPTLMSMYYLWSLDCRTPFWTLIADPGSPTLFVECLVVTVVEFNWKRFNWNTWEMRWWEFPLNHFHWSGNDHLKKGILLLTKNGEWPSGLRCLSSYGFKDVVYVPVTEDTLRGFREVLKTLLWFLPFFMT